MNTHGSLPNEFQKTFDKHLCRVCQRPFVSPLSIVPLVSQDAYVVELQCTNCEDTTVALLDEREMEHLDRELDRQSGTLRKAVAEAELADHLDRIACFCEALQEGHILPEDF